MCELHGAFVFTILLWMRYVKPNTDQERERPKGVLRFGYTHGSLGGEHSMPCRAAQGTIRAGHEAEEGRGTVRQYIYFGFCRKERAKPGKQI